MMKKFQVNTWNLTNFHPKSKLLHSQTLIMFVYCFSICSCAATRHTAVTANAQAQVEENIKDRYYTVVFRYPVVTNPNKWTQERATCHMLGDTLLIFTNEYRSPRYAVAKSFRVEDYRQIILDSGAIEVSFFTRECISGKESPIATPWRFVFYSIEHVEIHVNASFFGADASVFKGTLCPCEENLTTRSCPAIQYTVALENQPDTAMNLMGKKHGAEQQELREIFANRFYMIALSRTQSVLENGEIKYFSKESGNLNVCGDTLISTIWDCTDTSIPVQKHENRIQNYTLTQRDDGKIEVSFRIERLNPKRNKKTPVHYRLLASSPENITVFIDKTPYQGSLLPLY